MQSDRPGRVRVLIHRLLGADAIAIDSPFEPGQLVMRLGARSPGSAQVVSRPPRIAVRWFARTPSALGPVQHSATQVFAGEIHRAPGGARLEGTISTARGVLVFLAIFVVLASAGAQTLVEQLLAFVSGKGVAASDVTVGVAGLVIFSVPLVFYRLALVPFARRDRSALQEMLFMAATPGDADLTNPTSGHGHPTHDHDPSVQS